MYFAIWEKLWVSLSDGGESSKVKYHYLDQVTINNLPHWVQESWILSFLIRFSKPERHSSSLSRLACVCDENDTHNCHTWLSSSSTINKDPRNLAFPTRPTSYDLFLEPWSGRSNLTSSTSVTSLTPRKSQVTLNVRHATLLKAGVCFPRTHRMCRHKHGHI